MRTFIFMVLAPAVLFVLSVFFDLDAFFNPDTELRAVDAVHWMDDAKLKRTFTPVLQAELTTINKDKGVPIDKPCIRIDITVLSSVKDRFDQPLSFAGYEEVRINKFDALLAFNRMQPYQALLHVHGHSSARGKRKSFSVNLVAAQAISSDLMLDKFYLINMLEDPYAFKHKFAYDLLAEVGLFFPYQRYANLYLNGELQGLYLLVERPKDAIRRNIPDLKALFRTGPVSMIKRIYLAPDYVSHVDDGERIHSLAESNGQTLDQFIDMDLYMKWLAVNTLLENHDTVDELFLYEYLEENRKAKIGVMGWDYGDIQALPENNDYNDISSLILEKSTYLDDLILENRVHRSKYVSVFRDLLADVYTEEFLRQQIDDVKKQLDTACSEIPGIFKPEIIKTRAHNITLFEKRLLDRRAAFLELLTRLRD